MGGRQELKRVSPGAEIQGVTSLPLEVLSVITFLFAFARHLLFLLLI